MKTKPNNKQDSVPKPKGRAIIPCTGTVVKSCPNWHKTAFSSSELGAQHVSPHQIPKRPYLQEKDMPVACSRMCHVELRKLKLQWQKREFLVVPNDLTLREANHWNPLDRGNSGTSEKIDKPQG